MSDESPDPFAFGTKIVSGHPLYADVTAAKIIEEVLTPVLGAMKAQEAARVIGSRMVRHEPPIFYAEAEDFHE